MLRQSFSVLVLALMLSFASIADGQISDVAVDDLVAQLSDQNVDRRRDAAYELVRRQVDSENVVTAFAKAVSDGDTQVRFQALLGLARIPHAASPAIPQLIECLEHREDQVRFRAADALGKIGSSALKPLINAWSDNNERRRIAVAQALGLIGPDAVDARPILDEALKGATGELAREIANALVAISPGDEVMVLALCQHAAASVREVGIQSLAAVQSPSDAAIATIEAAMQDTDARVREISVIALAKSRLAADRKELLLEQGLMDQAAAVRAAAIAGLRKANLDGASFTVRLANRLANANPQEANSILKAISNFRSTGKQTLPMILDATEKNIENAESEFDIDQVVTTLAGFGDTVVIDLLKALERRPKLEPILSRALGEIGSGAIPSVLAGMDHQSELIRIASTRAIGNMRQLDQRLLARLEQALSDSSAEVRSLAVDVLVNRATPDESLKQTLMVAANDQSAKVRATALKAISKFGVTGDAAAKVIEPALRDPAAEVRVSAIDQVLNTTELLSRFRANVLDLANDSEASVRTMAARALGKLPPSEIDAAVIDTLVHLMQEDATAVSVAATQSVQALKLDSEQVLETLASRLSRDVEVVTASLEAIKTLGEKSSSLTEPVGGLLVHQRADVRVAAVETLAEIDKDHAQLTQKLVPLLDDTEWEVRRIAAVRLGKLGPVAKSATLKLFTLLKNEQDSDFANSALREIDSAPADDGAVEFLLEHVAAEDRRTSFHAISLLGKLGPAAKDALPTLEAMLQDRGPAGRGNREFRKRFLEEAIANIKKEP